MSPEKMHNPYASQAPLVIFGHYRLPFDAPRSPVIAYLGEPS